MNTQPATTPRLPLGLDAVALREPGLDRMGDFREKFASAALSYPDVGATQDVLPTGWEPDTHEVRLGDSSVFTEAIEALARWTMFDLPWVRMHPESGQQPGDLVTFASYQYGMWMLHACRTVYRIDEDDRVGFGYGTLEGHAVAGEEQFLVSRRDDQVFYSVRKFSRLNHPLAKLAGPLAKGLQRRFSVESAVRMQRECVR